MKIAQNAARLLKLIPTIKMIAVTGSLAMENCSEDSDIDLMIVTGRGTLWTTRLFTYSLIRLFNIRTRNSSNKVQKDKLCLNVWLDESDLIWRQRNIYTAHEIAQIVPLVSKDKTYEKFLFKNKWVLSFWPNAARISEERRVKSEKVFTFYLFPFTLGVVENLAYQLQYGHMKSKITNEVVTKTRALFHPQDWGKIVLSRLTLN